MTNQEKIQVHKLKEWCQNIIELGTKATQGPWHIKKGRSTTSDDWIMLATNGDVIFDCSFQDYEGGGTPPNADDEAFIVSCRNTTPATAKMLLAAITALEAECTPFNFPDEDRPIAYQALIQIITTWNIYNQPSYL